MSNIAMRSLPFLLGLVFISTLGCSTRDSTPTFAPGRPVLRDMGSPTAAKIDRLEISARFPGVEAWTAGLEKSADGVWRMAGDRADGKLVGHFLEVLETFATEAAGARGNDASFGLNPYRMEIRFTSGGATKVLRLGDLTGTFGIYFRAGEKGEPWIGRGALIAFLPTIESPEAFRLKAPFALSFDEVRTLTLEKTTNPGAGHWTFERRGEAWISENRPLAPETSAILERIARQRLEKLGAPPVAADFSRPDWQITVRSEKTEETLEIVFALGEVLGRNPARSDRSLVLYPEFAGALRAFTQARFTPVRSRTK